jgi:hypothetical protein
MDFSPLNDDRRNTAFWDLTAFGLEKFTDVSEERVFCIVMLEEREILSNIYQTTDSAGTPRFSNNYVTSFRPQVEFRLSRN